MTAFDRLKSLCDSQGISVNDLEEKLEIGKNSLQIYLFLVYSEQY